MIQYKIQSLSGSSAPTTQFDFDQRDKFIKNISLSPKSFQIAPKRKRNKMNERSVVKSIKLIAYIKSTSSPAVAFSFRDSSSISALR